jgi:hypothetical protein
MSHYVAEDESARYRTGHILRGDATAYQASAKGVVLMPIDESDVELHPMGGAHMRHYGDGLALETAPTRHRATSIFLGGPTGFVYWVGRFAAAADTTLEIRLTNNNSGVCSLDPCGITQDGQARHVLVKGASVLIGNRCRVSSRGMCMANLDLYGYGQRVLLHWLAISFSQRPEAWRYAAMA